MTAALVVGGIIGAGIFMLPVALAPLGVNAIVGWLVGGIGMMSLAFAGSRIVDDEGGGIQAYVARGLGPGAGFVVTWAIWCSLWTSNVALGLATVSALSRVVPALAHGSATIAATIALLVILWAVNLSGVRSAGRLTVVTVLIKILPLVAAILIAGVRWSGGAPLERVTGPAFSWSSIAVATSVCLFALTGFESVLTPVGKIFDPRRTIPKAILCGTTLVVVLYLLSTTALCLLLPVDELVASPTPFADAIGSAAGERAASLVAVAIAVSAFGCLNVGVLVSTEVLYSMALRGDVPAMFARTNNRQVAAIALTFTTLLSIVLALLNSSKTTASLFIFMTVLSANAALVLYALAALTALRIDRRPSTLVAVAVGLAFVMFAFYGSGVEATMLVVLLVVAGLGLRRIMRGREQPGLAATEPKVPR
jgi:APA family basic amino acid/polyamine antiporter